MEQFRANTANASRLASKLVVKRHLSTASETNLSNKHATYRQTVSVQVGLNSVYRIRLTFSKTRIIYRRKVRGLQTNVVERPFAPRVYVAVIT